MPRVAEQAGGQELVVDGIAPLLRRVLGALEAPLLLIRDALEPGVAGLHSAISRDREPLRGFDHADAPGMPSPNPKSNKDTANETANGAAGPTKSAKRRAKLVDKVKKQLAAQPKSGAAAPVAEEHDKPATFGAAVSATQVPQNLWHAIEQMKEFVQHVNQMKTDPDQGLPNPGSSRRPPAKWLWGTGARYDMDGNNELLDDPDTYDSLRK